MKLTSVQVTKFKCVEDSQPWRVDQVTCLVGKNEAGKSALLEALYKLNPVEDDVADFKPVQYPRRFALTDDGKKDQAVANVLTTKWELETKDLELLKAELPEVVLAQQPDVTISKGYDNELYWSIQVDERATLDKLIEPARFDAAEKAALRNPTSLEALGESLRAIAEPKPKHQSLLAHLNAKYEDVSLGQGIAAVLTAHLPHFVYFKEYEKMPGRVSINDLVLRQQKNTLTFGHRVFKALLELANSSAEEIANAPRSEELIMNLEAISNRLTNEIFEYWSQNKHLRVEFRCDMARTEDSAPYNSGWVFSTRIRNERHQASVNFDERSTGFIWFFSFLVWFSQMKENYGDKLIVLLDEPGLTLHGKAQKDLLRYLRERLQPEYQVIYTTHSPFMLDVENIFSLRTVEDVVKRRIIDDDLHEEILGTKVGERILSGDRDTILPLQGLLGYDITQTLFVGPYVLVVEGPSEWAYINWFTRRLIGEGRTSLDIRWAVAPAEGAPKVSSFVTLFKGRGLKIAALLDWHVDQKKMIENLEKSRLLDDGHLLKTTDFLDQTEADIEDFLGWEMYAALVNGALQIPEQHRLPSKKPEGCEIRIAKEVERRAKLLPPGLPEFDHYLPAEYLNRLSAEEIKRLPGLDKALDHFESLFTRVNNLAQ